jgi:dolichol kinase
MNVDLAPPDDPASESAPDADGTERPAASGTEASGTEASGTEASPHGSFSYTAEVWRKALHFLALVVPLWMALVGKPASLYGLVPSALLGVAADVGRAHSPALNRVIKAIFGPLMRDDELPEVGSGVTFNGATCVLVGAALLTIVFPVSIAVPVFTMTMIADAAAALVGRRFGRHRWVASRPHTIEGSAAFVATGLLVMAFFPALPFGVAAMGVAAAALLEAAPLPVAVNDNIRVPLVAAAVVAAGQAWVLGQAVPLGV